MIRVILYIRAYACHVGRPSPVDGYAMLSTPDALRSFLIPCNPSLWRIDLLLVRVRLLSYAVLVNNLDYDTLEVDR